MAPRTLSDRSFTIAAAAAPGGNFTVSVAIVQDTASDGSQTFTCTATCGGSTSAQTMTAAPNPQHTSEQMTAELDAFCNALAADAAGKENVRMAGASLT